VTPTCTVEDGVAALEHAGGPLTVLCGAGLSTECGVPDFRSPGSPWLVNKPIGFAAFMADASMRAEAWRRKFALDDIYHGSKPGRGHQALRELAETGRLDTVITQNIDGLQQAAGFPEAQLIEVHGNGTYARCLGCGAPMELAEARRLLTETGAPPACSRCGGIVKSATVSFGEAIDPRRIEAACAAAARARAFLVVGSSLLVRPAASFPVLAKRHGAALVIVNREATPLDVEADCVVRADVGSFLCTLAYGHGNNTRGLFALTNAP
jgi:NAD-dependent deacetylase